jgi:hypothetical protein
MRCSVIEYVVTDVSKFQGLFHPEDEGTTILRNSGAMYLKTQHNIPEDFLLYCN